MDLKQTWLDVRFHKHIFPTHAPVFAESRERKAKYKFVKYSFNESNKNVYVYTEALNIPKQKSEVMQTYQIPALKYNQTF